MLPAFRNIIIAVAVSALVAPATCQAQSPKLPLALRIEPFAASPRSYSPILIEVTLDPRAERLIEGTLRLRFSESDLKLLEVRIPDIVVADAEYKTTLLLPPMPTSSATAVDVTAWFVTDTEEYLLSAPNENSALSLQVTSALQRGLVLGMLIDGRTAGIDTGKFGPLSKALNFGRHARQPVEWVNNLRGKPELTRARIGWFACSRVMINPDAVVSDPLAFCAFDIVALSDGGLAQLDQGRIDALKKWVRAGGSLCVVPDGAIQRRHTNFLADLMVEHPQPPTFVLNSSGDLIPDWDGIHVQAELGLGRVVVLAPNTSLKTALGLEPDKAQEDADLRNEAQSQAQTTARQIAGFLWKIRADQPLPAEEDKENLWKIPTPAPYDPGDDEDEWNRSYRMREYQDSLEATTERMVGSDMATNQLMPANVRMVPLWLVSTMLAAYVFIVGPGDYLLLGLLKIRRFTWVVFPIVTVLFTAALIGVSNYYMATTENGGSLEISDVVGKGEIVRRTVVDLDYLTAQRNMDEDHKSMLVTKMRTRGQMFDRRSIGSPALAPAAFSGDSSGLYFEGRIPGRFSTHRTVNQWEPQQTRSLEITSLPGPNCGFNWEQPGEIWTADGRNKLAAAIKTANPLAGAVVLHGSEILDLAPLPYRSDLRRGHVLEWYDQSELQDDWRETDYFTLLAEISNRSQHFFRYVSAISPNGASNFEDLAMLDSSDPDQWLLIVSWHEGDTQKVYRRLYRQSKMGPATPDNKNAGDDR